MPATNRARRQQPEPTPTPKRPKLESLEEIRADPESKEWTDLRDRLAYIFITGSYPTHLRPETVGLLRQTTHVGNEAKGIDGEGGAVSVLPEFMLEFKLDRHPMVRQTRKFLDHQYKILQSRGLKTRRPFGKIFVYRPLDEHRAQLATILVDGAVREGID